MSSDTAHEQVLAERANSSSHSASVLPLPPNAFRRWLGQAKPGDRLEYHRGFLTVDRSSASRRTERERRLTKLADAVLKAAEADRVHLVQRRNGAADFTYLAIKPRPNARRAATSPPVPAVASTTAHLSRQRAELCR